MIFTSANTSQRSLHAHGAATDPLRALEAFRRYKNASNSQQDGMIRGSKLPFTVAFDISLV